MAFEPDIAAATTAEDYQCFAALVREYVDWCSERYADEPGFMKQVFGHQAIESELQAPESSYGPPVGRTLLARADGEAVGCIAYRRIGNAICEMKRLYVRKTDHGRGTGRRLCLALLDAARQDGYALVRLDTASRLAEAIALYRSLGFRGCPAYNHYPPELADHIVYMELPLVGCPSK